ncbi:MAG: hypothetical protein IJT05_03185 [Lachnospiraceae bacterium]|nr:hypothetical protein [Lachnospiraceae bacterium]
MKKKMMAALMAGCLLFAAGCGQTAGTAGGAAGPNIVVDGQTLVLGKTTYGELKNIIANYNPNGEELEFDGFDEDLEVDYATYSLYLEGLEFTFASDSKEEAKNVDAIRMVDIDIDNFALEEGSKEVNGTVDGLALGASIADLKKVYGEVKGEYAEDSNNGLYSWDEYDVGNDFVYVAPNDDYEIQYSFDEGSLCLIYASSY